MHLKYSTLKNWIFLEKTINKIATKILLLIFLILKTNIENEEII